MKTNSIFFALIITLFFGCKGIPVPEEPEEINALTQDEIDIIDEVINYIIVNDIRLPKEQMQVCMFDTLYVYKSRYTDSYENDLLNSENYLKNSFAIDEKIISSFIKRNMRRRTIDRNVKFKADFFWNGGSPAKDYFRIIFSNIGFNENTTEALVYAYIDLLSGRYSIYVYLRKVNGVWRFSRYVPL